MTREPDQEWPQMAAATTIGRSSLRAMEGRLTESGQENWNQKGKHQPPQPQLPEASVKRWWRGESSVIS